MSIESIYEESLDPAIDIKFEIFPVLTLFSVLIKKTDRGFVCLHIIIFYEFCKTRCGYMS